MNEGCIEVQAVAFLSHAVSRLIGYSLFTVDEWLILVDKRKIKWVGQCPRLGIGLS